MKKIVMILFILVVSIISAKEFRIMTYNIYGGRLTNGETLGKSIKKYNPDFVSLQEVDKNTNRSNFRNLTQDIATELGYNYYFFQKARDYDSGEFGISIISKYPVEKIFVYELPSIGIEKRQLIGAKLIEGTFKNSVSVINTHLDYNEEIKDEQLNSLLITSEIIEGDVKFLTGDLNLLPTTKYYKNLINEWEDTYLDGNNERKIEDIRIDYIFGNKNKNWKLKESYFIKDNSQEWLKLSDHLPYMSIVDIE